MYSLRQRDNRRSLAERLLLYMLPGLAVAIGALLGLLTSDHISPVLVVLTALVTVCGFAVPPAVDALSDRVSRRAQHQQLLAQRSDTAAAQRAEQLRSHFHPRGRGILPSLVREGSYFMGRLRVLRELVDWINGAGLDVAWSRVVTGAPGSGKSAVLGRLVSLADAGQPNEVLATAPAGTRPPVGSISMAVHVRGRTADEVAAEISQALTIDEGTCSGLLAHLREDVEHRPTVVVVDGVDEAADAHRLIVDLLEPLAAASERTGIRLLVGTRRGGEDHLLRLFGASALILDLDDEQYLDRRDVAEYVCSTLLADPDPQVRTPYRARPALAEKVAVAVAARAGSSFLVAQLTALSLMGSDEPVDTGSSGWAETFPTTVGTAMDRYLRDVQPGGPWLRDLLMALAWSQGDGFSDPGTWAAAATLLGTAAYSERDVTRLLLDSAAVDLLHRSTHGDRVAFRLFHEALGEHLRQLSTRQRPAAEVHRRLADILVEKLSSSSLGERDWAHADSYTRTYLPFHAGEGQVLDQLLDDAGFLAAVDPARLLTALPEARTGSGRRVARIIQRVGQQLLVAPEDERICYLEMAAHMSGDVRLAGELAATAPDRPWSVLWARWDALIESRMLGHHDDYVLAVDTVETARGIVVLSASAWGIQAWRLADGEPMVTGVREPDSPILDMAAFRQGDGIAIVTLHEDGHLLRTSPDAGDPQRILAEGRAPNGVWSLDVAGQSAVATVSRDHVVEVLSARDGHVLDLPPVVIGRDDRVLMVDNVGGQCFAVVSGDSADIKMWDLTAGRQLSEPLRPGVHVPGWRSDTRFWAASLAERQDGPVFLLGTTAGQVIAWDPIRGEVVGDPQHGDAGVFTTLVTGHDNDLWCWGDWNGNLFMHGAAQEEVRQLAVHDGGVQALAQCELNGARLLISGGRDGAVRAWNVQAARPVASFGDHHSVVAGADSTRQSCIASIRADGSLVIFEADAGGVLAELRRSAEEGFRCAAVMPGDPRSFVTLDRQRRITLRGFPDGRPSHDFQLAADEEWRSIAVMNRQRPLLLVTATSGRLGFFDLATCDAVRPPLACHTGRFMVAPLPEQPDEAHRFITWDWECFQARLWNVRSDETRHLDLPVLRVDNGDPFSISAVSFGHIGDIPVAVGVGGYSRLHIWNTEDGSLMIDAQLEQAHHMALLDVDTTQIDRQSLMLSGGHTCSAALWSAESRREHHLRVGSPLQSTRFLPGNRAVVAGSRGIMVLELGSRLLSRFERP
ncbi:AAA family ATPase [Streptomyces sp. NBC_01283]|uniref:AAA family ATPase n=1 Tax=Streptomyces sp. NBC_01283 TaxID=2903812 RepID=UPI00352F4CB9|nr:AAA family ATPase [Streptomyces sp. NBC_01283]